jgi:hypothetical protein
VNDFEISVGDAIPSERAPAPATFLLGQFPTQSGDLMLAVGRSSLRTQVMLADFLVRFGNAVSCAYANPGESIEIGVNYGADGGSILVGVDNVQMELWDDLTRSFVTFILTRSEFPKFARKMTSAITNALCSDSSFWADSKIVKKILQSVT